MGQFGPWEGVVMGQEPSQSRTFRKHREGCVAPLVNAECDCPPEIVYVPSDEAAVERAAKALAEDDGKRQAHLSRAAFDVYRQKARLALRAAGGGQ